MTLVGEQAPQPDRVRTGMLSALGRSVPDRRRLLWLVGAQLAAGIVLGLLWLAWSPTSVSYYIDLGGGPVVIPAESESQIAADGRFAALTAVAGLMFGLLAWWRGGNRGRIALAALAVSSLLSSLVALATGELLSGGHRTARVNTAFHPPLTLHAMTAVFLQALVAVLAYTLLVGLGSDQSLGHHPESEPDPAGHPDAGPPAGTRPDGAHPAAGHYEVGHYDSQYDAADPAGARPDPADPAGAGFRPEPRSLG